MKVTPVRRAAVLGSGVMGAQIAAHLANAGVPVTLVDLRADAPADPNRIAREGLGRARTARPPAFFSERPVSLVSVGNFEDDLAALEGADWIIEAIVENLDVKRSVYRSIAPHVGARAVVSSNTSGISIASLGEALPESLRPRFLATHFFNPPRHLYLLEIVPGPFTDPGVVAAVTTFAEERLGKGVVVAKDTPGFIANRIGVHAMMNAFHLAIENGLRVDEADALTGPLIGRPKSATFRTADVVGLDTLVHVADDLVARLPGDPDRARLEPPALVRTMVERRLLGEKSRQGFYRRVGSGADRKILALDLETLEHVETPRPALDAIAEGRKTADLTERLRALVARDDREGRFLWRCLSDTCVYAAGRIPEIADDTHAVDDAMRWGFGWKLGPFELWNALGAGATADRLRREGRDVPPVVTEMLESSRDRFRAERSPDPRRLSIGARAAGGATIESGDAARLVDIGEDVVALELTSTMGAVEPATIDALARAVDRVEREHRGLVIAGGEAFSAGANLKLILSHVRKGEYGAVESIVRSLQTVNQRLRYAERPVVAATRGFVLGAGCEIAMATDCVVAAAESYVGLPELGAGVIPAGGGLKELMVRAHDAVPHDLEMDIFPLIRRLFQIVGTARVSQSALEAQELGFLRPADVIEMNAGFRIERARRAVLALDLAGYRPGRPREDVRVAGAPALATMRATIVNVREAGRLTAYDARLSEELAWVLAGGDLTGPARVSEEYLLTLEREAFMRRVREPKTHERIAHLMETGKPLRN